MRTEWRRTFLAERLDVTLITEVITELDDLGHTTKMLSEGDDAFEHLRQIVNRPLAVVQMGGRDPLKMQFYQVIHEILFLSDGQGADLFVVTDNDDIFRKRQCE